MVLLTGRKLMKTHLCVLWKPMTWTELLWATEAGGTPIMYKENEYQ